MGQLSTIEKQLKELGFQVVALSPDKPEKLKVSAKKWNPSYILLSDSDAKAIRALGLAFVVARKTIERYKRYKIDLVAASGRKHNILPVPAVLLIDRNGMIRFIYANPNYRVRVDPAVVLAAAKAMLKKPTGKPKK